MEKSVSFFLCSSVHRLGIDKLCKLIHTMMYILYCQINILDPRLFNDLLHH